MLQLRSTFFAATIALFLASASRAGVVKSISDISGTTIDFNTGATAHSITSPFGIATTVSGAFSAPVGISPLITGSAAAPITAPMALSFGAAPGTWFEFTAISAPWSAIGIAANSGAFIWPATFRFEAFDAENETLADFTTTTSPGPGTTESYNQAAVFLGFTSATPIHRVRVSQIGSSATTDRFGILDNLRFQNAASSTQVVPEPASLAVWSCLGLTALGSGWWRKRRSI